MKRMDEGLAFLLRYENIAWYENGQVKILDRRVYPSKIEFVVCNDYIEVKQAITDMVTQSAGPYTAVGMGMCLAAYQYKDMNISDRIEYLKKAAYELAHARPTTVNRMSIITNACFEVAKKALENNENPIEAIFNRTIDSLERRYSKMSKVAKNLVSLIPDNSRVLTQCFGETIVGCMGREIKNRNKKVEFFCAETRPYLQGAKLTASVLKDQGFDVTLISDNMVAWTIQEKNINVFTSAADTICMDGHIVNKVGTLQISILCKYFKIPYYVTGIPDKGKYKENIVIEERKPEDVLSIDGKRIAMEGVKAYYPAFDITPPHLVSAVITDKKIFTPYDLENYYDGTDEEYY